jgi:hypothetical protein
MSSLIGSLLPISFLLDNPQPLNSSRKENNYVVSIEYVANLISNSKQKQVAPYFNFIKFDSTTYEKGIIETNNSVSAENDMNNRRLFELEQKFSRRFISHILEDDFEYGMNYKAHIIVKEQMNINAMATKEWLNRIFVSNYENSKILIGILRVIARFERDEIYPIGDTMALASLAHGDEIVQETAIRVFESWGGIDSLKLLENVSVSSKWVKEYLNEVISDLKAEYVS